MLHPVVPLNQEHLAREVVNKVNALAKVLVCSTILCGSLPLTFAQNQTPSPSQASTQNGAMDPALLAKATAGDAPSILLLAKAYTTGSGVDQDDTIAAEWMRKAADLGNMEAQIRLAECYRDGKGVTRDLTQAAAWYRKAAEQGNPSAQATLGSLYSMGQGVSRDDVEAFFWFDLAASANGPNQEKYAANRQIVGTRITMDEVTFARQRVARWKTAHARSATGE